MYSGCYDGKVRLCIKYIFYVLITSRFMRGRLIRSETRLRFENENKRDLKCVSDVKANEIKNTDRTQKQTQLENKYGSHLYKTKLKIQIGHENKLRVWQNSHARHNGGIIREVFQRQTLYDI